MSNETSLIIWLLMLTVGVVALCVAWLVHDKAIASQRASHREFQLLVVDALKARQRPKGEVVQLADRRGPGGAA